jgi:hypothetical protein
MSRPIIHNQYPNTRASTRTAVRTPSWDDNSYSDNSSPPSPPCDNTVLQDLNSGTSNILEFSVPDESFMSPFENNVIDNESDASISSDDTWTPSIEGEESEDDVDLDDLGSIWQEIPLRYQDFNISFNKVDTDLEYGYLEEVKEVKKRLLREFDSMISGDSKRKTTLNVNETMNAVYNAELLFGIIGFQNKSLVERKKFPMDFKEFEVFLRAFLVCAFINAVSTMCLSILSRIPF